MYDVVALGELLVDFTENGRSAQGNTLFEANPGGAPCNVLAMLCKLGHSCAFIGKDVEKYIEKTDKSRSDFYRYYTGQEWNDARNYDLCLNSERLGFDGTMEAIKAYIRVRFGKLPNEN